MPRGFYTDAALDNLRRLVDSKATLIKEAIGAGELPIEVSDDRVAFPWFKTLEAAEAKAYAEFISKLSIMAKEAKRVTATDKAVDNPKYAFRCFLLRLGFIGNDSKAARKILLRNLSGHSAFRNKAEEEKFRANQKAKRDAAKAERLAAAAEEAMTEAASEEPEEVPTDD